MAENTRSSWKNRAENNVATTAVSSYDVVTIVWWEHYGQTALNRGLRQEDRKD